MKYVIIYQTAPSNMGGDWSKPIRTVVEARNDDKARQKIKEINQKWAHVIACFPENSEVK